MPPGERLLAAAAAVRRGLRQSRGTLVIAVLTLAAAIGMNVAVLGLVSRALLTPPAGLKDPARLFSLAFEHTGEDGVPIRQATTSWPAFRKLGSDVPAIAGAAAWQRGPGGITVGGEQRAAETLLVSDTYFDVLGTRPLLGAGMQAGSRDPVVVLSHRFWHTAFGADPAVLGRPVTLRGKTFQVAGVMPEAVTGHTSSTIDAWFPIEEALADSPGWDHPLRNVVSVFVRGRDGEAGLDEQASAVLARKVVSSALAGGDVPAQDKRIAWWLAAVSALVLLIGLANAGTLLAVRAARHQRETLIRIALGATRLRLLAQVAGEALLIGLAASGASLLFARIVDGLVRGVWLPSIVPAPAWDPVTAAGAALAGVVAAAVAFATGAMYVRVSGRAGMLRGQRRAGTALQRGLLLVQVAISVLLLAGAGMFGRSLYGLMSQDLGIDVDGLLVADFEAGPGSVQGQDDLFTAALSGVRQRPGVTAAAAYQSMPFSGFHVPPIAVPGRAEPPQTGGQLPFLLAATPGFMDLLGIRVIEGRGFTPADDRGAPVVIVNETMARGVWPGESAVGKCIRIGFDPDFDPFTASGPPTPSAALPCRQVIGVARDVRQRSLVPTGSEAALMQYYVPFTQVPGPPAGLGGGPHINGLIIRSSRADAALTAAVRGLVSAGRTDVPFVRVRPYTELFARQIRPWQVGTTLLVVFSGLAGMIAAVGLYAAFAHAVAIRRREMAIRLAIGASAARVRRLVVRDAVVLTMAGGAIGAAGALLAGRSIGAVLYGIVGADPLVLGGAMLMMLGIAWLATLIPAVAASRSDPNLLLRSE